MARSFFKDKHGKTAIVQSPNPLITGWFGLAVVNYFAHSLLLAWLATALLFAWAFLELYQGASQFRRVLGLVVIVFIVISRLA